MSFRILHIFSSNFFAGSVAYALQVAEHQQRNGHTVFIATDQEGLSDSVSCFKLPVADRSFLQRICNILDVRRILREQRINVIHAHSRAASWIAHYASLGSDTAVVSTIHGRQVKHSRLKADVYGEKVIAICEQLADQLTCDLRMERGRLTVLPNPFDFSRLKNVNRAGLIPASPVISVIGRLNGPKGDHVADLVADVFPKLLERYDKLSVRLIGGEWESFPPVGKEGFLRLQQRFGDRISYCGFTKSVYELIASSSVVIGAGRVALESLGIGVPLFALGEACCHGFITPDNVDAAIASNFGDILATARTFTLDSAGITTELSGFLDGASLQLPDPDSFAARYDESRILPEISLIYSAAIMRRISPRPIPVLMYHRVPASAISARHKTFVEASKFAGHLKFFAWRGMQTLTFKDYLAFSRGDRPAGDFPRKPLIITFDDGYLDNFTNMLPLAKRFGYRGVLFLLGDANVTANFWDHGENRDDNLLMSREHRKAFVASGWEIGAHTLAHPDLSKLDEVLARREICESKRALEEELGIDIVSFAYPFGQYSSRIKAMVEEAGFSFGIATDSGGITIEDDRFAVFRVNMFPNETLFSLFKKTSSWYRGYYYHKRGK
jgi:peptidoglycan/xylan/chitin deacetylase (PgdA/CDA1 family)